MMRARIICLSIVAAICAALLLASCSPTISRKEVKQSQASNTSTGQDSGILKDAESAKGGFLVNQDWVDGHDALLAKYGDKLFPPRKKGDRAGIVKEGAHYRVSDAVMEQHLVMNQRRVDEQGP